MRYEHTMHFGFAPYAGKNFQQNREFMLKYVGFSKEEAKAVSRIRQDDDSCLEMNYWKPGKGNL